VNLLRFSYSIGRGFNSRSGEGYYCRIFVSYLKSDPGVVPQIMTRTVSSIYVSINCLLITLSFDVI
jgi:hypothetical protein